MVYKGILTYGLLYGLTHLLNVTPIIVSANPFCCEVKKVGDVTYTLMSQEDTSGYGCKDNCVYSANNDPQSKFCFKSGDKEVQCLQQRVPLPRIGLYGGGGFYNESALKKHDLINKISQSSINTLTAVWVNLAGNGSITFAQGWPRWMNETILIQNGEYVGREDFPKELKDMSVDRIMFSMLNDVKPIEHHLATNKINLKKTFTALKEAFPFVAGFNLDFENDQSAAAQNTIVEFSSMMYEIGYNQITFNVYYGASWWVGTLKTIQEKHPGFITGFDLQTYDGGDGQDPCTWIREIKNQMGKDFDAENFVFPGFAVKTLELGGAMCPDEIQSNMSKWKKECKLNGGWLWRVEEIIDPDPGVGDLGFCNMSSRPTIEDYAKALLDGLNSE